MAHNASLPTLKDCGHTYMHIPPSCVRVRLSYDKETIPRVDMSRQVLEDRAAARRAADMAQADRYHKEFSARAAEIRKAIARRQHIREVALPAEAAKMNNSKAYAGKPTRTRILGRFGMQGLSKRAQAYFAAEAEHERLAREAARLERDRSGSENSLARAEELEADARKHAAKRERIRALTPMQHEEEEKRKEQEVSGCYERCVPAWRSVTRVEER